MRLASCGLLACLYTVVNASIAVRPYELLVYRDLDSLQCNFASIRETQIFKGLYHEGIFAPKTTPLGEEQLRFVNWRSDELWSRLHALCDKSGSGRGFPVFIGNGVPRDDISQDIAQTVLGTSNYSYSQDTIRDVFLPPLEVQPLISSGHPGNRVDLVFFSDGYTIEEKDKFIADATRLAMDISGNQTFNTVKPLLNFWAAFSPSKESGIGTGGVPKNTAFGLYRDGTELRGVYYSKPEVARAACLSLEDQCDYPILMGNDPLYGGLGGEFTVITPSLANGALVLRHELGHSIIDVGEEYDGGYAYFGVNAAPDLSTPISWSHWFTEPPYAHHMVNDTVDTTIVRVERSVMPMQAYPWTLLNVTDPWVAKFDSSGTYSKYIVRFSLSGLPDEEDLRVELDGEDLSWIPRPGVGIDRWHYDVHSNRSLAGGEHEVKFTLENSAREGIAQLCSVEILEFGDGKEFITTPGHYGVFPTFSDKNETSYRPTNEDCLMRIVTTANFCKVCLEGLWLSLLRRIELIDHLQVGCRKVESISDSDIEGNITRALGSWKRSFELDLVPLAQFREEALDASESYTITWLKDHEVIKTFTNKTRVEIDDNELALGSYLVDVRFATEEVRMDRDNLLRSGRAFTVTEHCGV